MEEDDDNFLDGVIEFGDGRQYTVNSSELERPDASDTQGVPSQSDDKPDPPNPVTKEERFVDDFDRSWPRSKGSPSSSAKEFSSHNPRSASPKPLPSHSPRESPRVLFNERSNRLEPYNHSHRQAQVQGPFGQKRPSLNEGNASDNLRGTREGSHNVQVLRKGTQMDMLDRIERDDGTPRQQVHVCREINPFLRRRAHLTIELVVRLWGRPLCLPVPRKGDIIGSYHPICRPRPFLAVFLPAILKYCLHWTFLGLLV